MSGRCVRCGLPAVHMHHRKLRRHGDHSEANLIPVCLGCHLFIHANVGLSYEQGWLVKSWDDPSRVTVGQA